MWKAPQSTEVGVPEKIVSKMLPLLWYYSYPSPETSREKEYVRKDYEKQIPVKTLLLNEIYEGGLFGCGTLWGCWIGGGILAQFSLSGRDNSTIRKLSKITHQMCLSNTLDLTFPHLNTQTRFEKGKFAGDIHFYTGFLNVFMLIYKIIFTNTYLFSRKSWIF